MSKQTSIAVLFAILVLIAVIVLSAGSWMSLSEADSNTGSTLAASASGAFPAECATCHGETPEYPVRGARAQYHESGHFLGFDLEEPHAFYANGGGCQSCHTHEGFVQKLTTGEVDTEGFVEWPSQPNCFSCHAPHERGDFSLRTTEAVSLVNGVTLDLGDGNLCANCHQARTSASEAVKETPASQVRSHFGPHHGPQANLVAATGAYEFEGRSYSSSQHKFDVEDACVGCHMPLPEGRYRLSAAVGGHSFMIVHDEGEELTVNATSCQGCHAGMSPVEGSRLFDTPAGEDYDADGTLEVAQAEVEGLLDRLVNPNGTGLLQQGEAPIYTASGAFNSEVPDDLMRSEAEMAALFNYKFFAEDRSLGIHNMRYTLQVLQDTVAALDPTFDRSTRPE